MSRGLSPRYHVGVTNEFLILALQSQWCSVLQHVMEQTCTFGQSADFRHKEEIRGKEGVWTVSVVGYVFFRLHPSVVVWASKDGALS